MTRNVVIVGGSLGGLRVAEQLRVGGFTGSLTVVGEERHMPYNRPPLSKEILADEGDDDDTARIHGRLEFRRRASVADVEFVLGEAVVAADLDRRQLRLAVSGSVAFDGLVVATGLRSRRLPVSGPGRGRHWLRTLDDCVGLRASAVRGARVVVVGAGFIGCETAATLSAKGCKVTVVEPFGAPMERVLGGALAGAVERHHERAGVRFELGTGVQAYDGDATVTGVILADGRRLDADVVVESVGSVCNTQWLEGNGLDLSDGVLTDNDLRVMGASAVVAVGDVARFPNPLFDDVPRRVEHWSVPTDTAKRAARTLLADLEGSWQPREPFAPIPSFWSDQFDLRFQSFGSPGLADEAVVREGSLDHLAAGLLVAYQRLGAHVGTVAVNLSAARQRELREEFVGRVPSIPTLA